MNKKGFTLIELLVVIAIIGLLSTLAVVALGSARSKARDSKRLSDLRAVQNSLEMYYAETAAYPVAATAVTLGDATHGCLGSTGFAAVNTCGANAYLNPVPSDPGTTNEYSYSTDANGTTYTLSAILETTVNNLSGTVNATPSGITTASST